MIPPMEHPVHDEKDVADNKDLASLGYVWILSIVVLLSRRDSPFVRFHARQGTALFVLTLLVWPIPYVGKLLEFLILMLCAAGFLNAAQGQWKELPIVGPLSRGSVSDLRNSWRDLVEACASLWKSVRSDTSTKDMKHEQDPPNPQPAPPTVPPVEPSPTMPHIPVPPAPPSPPAPHPAPPVASETQSPSGTLEA